MPLALADKYGMIEASRQERGASMGSDGTYNGYANYQTWNVCLWIANDMGFYSLAKDCDSYNEFKSLLKNDGMTLDAATMYETPDGVSWNDSGVNLAEMKEFWTENFSKVAA